MLLCDWLGAQGAAKYRNEWLAVQRADAPKRPFDSVDFNALSGSAGTTAASAAAASTARRRAARNDNADELAAAVLPVTLKHTPSPPQRIACFIQRGALRTNCIGII